MPCEDFREFMDTLEKSGDLHRIGREVDWNLEAGAIMRKGCEEVRPALLFEKIKDYPAGYRVVGNPLASFRRLAVALDLPPDATYGEILDRYDEGKRNPLKPVVVNDGPCKEEIHLGDDVDLYEFPALLMHGGDGGRYLCTWHITATKDPDSDWVNWGMYRAMIQDRNTLGGIILPFQHIGMIYAKYRERDEPMPFAISITPDPITAFIGAANPPYGVSEADVIGGFRGKPLRVIKCETNDLLVPASSEIIIEGLIPPDERMPEGPFGEYPGYEAGGRTPRPVYHVTAITHRKNPILAASNMGMPTDDCDVVNCTSYASDMRAELIKAGLPIVGVYMPPECCTFVLVVSTRTPFSGMANRIASCVWGSKGGSAIPKIIVVEADVNPTNMREVFHAFATAHHPIRGAHTLANTQGHNLIAYLSGHERTYGIGANVVYDCTWPKDWSKEELPKKQSFKDAYPREIQEQILRKGRI